MYWLNSFCFAKMGICKYDIFIWFFIKSVCSLLICSSLFHFMKQLKHWFYICVRSFQCIEYFFFFGLLLFMAVFMVCFLFSWMIFFNVLLLKFYLWKILWGKFHQKGFIFDSVRCLPIQNILKQNFIFYFLTDHWSTMNLGWKPMWKASS